jgi:hypothetical protein
LNGKINGDHPSNPVFVQPDIAKNTCKMLTKHSWQSSPFSFLLNNEVRSFFQRGFANYTIRRISAADTGEYICLASNILGQAEGRVVINIESRPGGVLPTVTPQIIQIDGEDLRRAGIGEDVTFICRSRGMYMYVCLS